MCCRASFGCGARKPMLSNARGKATPLTQPLSPPPSLAAQLRNRACMFHDAFPRRSPEEMHRLQHVPLCWCCTLLGSSHDGQDKSATSFATKALCWVLSRSQTSLTPPTERGQSYIFVNTACCCCHCARALHIRRKRRAGHAPRLHTMDFDDQRLSPNPP